MSILTDAHPVAYRYRWKIDGEWTGWRVSDASQKSEHLRDLEEVPLYLATVTPPPSPDVAGVVDADLIERVSGRLKQRAHNREQLEGIKASHAIEHVAATLLESLSAALRPFAKEGAQVKYVGYDNSYSASGFLPDLTVGDFRRARTALTPKEKA